MDYTPAQGIAQPQRDYVQIPLRLFQMVFDWPTEVLQLWLGAQRAAHHRQEQRNHLAPEAAALVELQSKEGGEEAPTTFIVIPW